MDSGGAMRVSTIPQRTSHRFIPTIPQRQREASLIDVQQAMTARMARGFEVLMAALLFGLASPRLALGRKAAQHQALPDAPHAVSKAMSWST